MNGSFAFKSFCFHNYITTIVLKELSANQSHIANKSDEWMFTEASLASEDSLFSGNQSGVLVGHSRSLYSLLARKED